MNIVGKPIQRETTVKWFGHMEMGDVRIHPTVREKKRMVKRKVSGRCEGGHTFSWCDKERYTEQDKTKKPLRRLLLKKEHSKDDDFTSISNDKTKTCCSFL